jgi:hypothetical protein
MADTQAMIKDRRQPSPPRASGAAPARSDTPPPAPAGKRTKHSHASAYPSFLALPLDIPAGEVRAFDAGVRAAARSWLQQQLANLGSTHTVAELTDDRVLAAYFACNVAGVDRATLRKAWDGVDPGGKAHNAQFHPWRGWRKSGFGVPVRYDLAMGLRAAVAARAALVAATGRAWAHTDNLPHLIAKLPGKARDGGLAEHHDGGSLADALAAALHFHSFEAWGAQLGWQVLAHVQVTGGHTGCIRHLTPARYAVCLLLFLHGYVAARQPAGGAAQPVALGWPAGFTPPTQGWFHTSGGPVFQPWKAMIPAANRVLAHLQAHAHTGPEGVVAAATGAMATALASMHAAGHLAPVLAGGAVRAPPLEACIMAPDTGACSSMVVAWPVLTPHWAEATGPAPRYTFTVPLRLGSGGGVTGRALAHLQRMAEVAGAGGERRRELVGALERDNAPWNQGRAHVSPGRMAALALPHFQHLLVDESGVRAYVAAMSGDTNSV